MINVRILVLLSVMALVLTLPAIMCGAGKTNDSSILETSITEISDQETFPFSLGKEIIPNYTITMDGSKVSPPPFTENTSSVQRVCNSCRYGPYQRSMEHSSQ